MHVEDFNKIVDQNHKYEHITLVEKAKEYAEPTNRFRNFNNMAHFMAQGNTPEAACWNVMAKHLEATMSAVSKLAEGTVQPIEFWVEKLGDIRIYSLLLMGLIEERLANIPIEPLFKANKVIKYTSCCNAPMPKDFTEGYCPVCQQLCTRVHF